MERRRLFQALGWLILIGMFLAMWGVIAYTEGFLEAAKIVTGAVVFGTLFVVAHSLIDGRWE